MSKKAKTRSTVSKNFKLIQKVNDISEFVLKTNGLRVLYKYIPDTKVVTTNITYLAGARDEQAGETGVAHMLEHMLFKPTSFDLKNKSDSAAMQFEREVGVVLNANTWLDRTTYYFSYEKSHFSRALKIEAERMRDVVLSDKEFQPERTNVLSEFDMYNGDPKFALSVTMCSCAFLSHPYGHETIGFREDIEAYTVEKLRSFYEKFYAPNNATLMIIGDIEEKEALDEIAKNFSHLKVTSHIPKPVIIEPKQEGIRRVEVKRPGTTQIVAIGLKHPGLPSAGWYETALSLELLADGEDNILHRELVDKGLATSVVVSQEPTRDTNLAVIYITLTKKITHEKMEALVRKIVSQTQERYIKRNLPTLVTKSLTDEIFNRDSSLNIAAELTEFVAAGDWTAYSRTEKTMKNISVKQIKDRIDVLFREDNMTIGFYKSF